MFFQLSVGTKGNDAGGKPSTPGASSVPPEYSPCVENTHLARLLNDHNNTYTHQATSTASNDNKNENLPEEVAPGSRRDLQSPGSGELNRIVLTCYNLDQNWTDHDELTEGAVAGSCQEQGSPSGEEEEKCMAVDVTQKHVSVSLGENVPFVNSQALSLVEGSTFWQGSKEQEHFAADCVPGMTLSQSVPLPGSSFLVPTDQVLQCSSTEVDKAIPASLSTEEGEDNHVRTNSGLTGDNHCSPLVHMHHLASPGASVSPKVEERGGNSSQHSILLDSVQSVSCGTLDKEGTNDNSEGSKTAHESVVPSDKKVDQCECDEEVMYDSSLAAAIATNVSPMRDSTVDREAPNSALAELNDSLEMENYTMDFQEEAKNCSECTSLQPTNCRIQEKMANSCPDIGHELEDVIGIASGLVPDEGFTAQVPSKSPRSAF